MRRLATLIAAIGLAASLSACGNTEKDKPVKPPNTENLTTVSDTDTQMDIESEAEGIEPAVTTAPVQSEEDAPKYTTTAYSVDENGYYIYDTIEPVKLDDIVLYDMDGIKVIGKEINSNGLSIDESIPGFNLVCEVINNSDRDTRLGLRHIYFNDTGIGWANLNSRPIAKAGETITGSFVFPMSSVITHTGFNTSDIEKFCFTMTNVVDGEDRNGEPMEIILKK